MDLDTAQFVSRRLIGHAPFVGLIAMHFNEAERRFQQLVGTALGLPPCAAASLATGGAVQPLADMLKATARRDGRSELIFALPFAARLFDACRANRNLIVHGIYANPLFAPQEVLVMRKTTARGGVRPGQWAVSVAELEQVIVEILATSEFLAALNRALEGEEPEHWPEAPPMPRRRSDSLEAFGEAGL